MACGFKPGRVYVFMMRAESFERRSDKDGWEVNEVALEIGFHGEITFTLTRSVQASARPAIIYTGLLHYVYLVFISTPHV